MATDTAQSPLMYHHERSDRPIRPLPKRRLRERLSPEVAESIEYPPARQSAPALFLYPCDLKGRSLEQGSSSSNREPRSDFSGRHPPRGSEASGLESDEVSSRRAVAARTPTGFLGRSPRTLPKSETTQLSHSPQPPPSAASSADGYDSFENTNNKKKRKIPTVGEINGAHGVGDHGLNDISSIVSGQPTTPDRPEDKANSASVPYYGSGSSKSSSQNVSGPGRGRFGRARNGRTPLQTLSDASGNLIGRSSKNRLGHWSPTAQSTGIISNAIANAEKLPALEGQENTSLLHQQQSAKPSPATTQFTFTCDSHVPGTLAWPGAKITTPSPPDMDHNKPVTGGYTNSHSGQKHKPLGVPGAIDQEHSASESNSRVEGTQTVGLERKNRRRAARDLHLQASQRREVTARQNFLNPPKPEDQWICEFCEYERIFGYPPVALIRQYEIKDRKVRQQEEERRRVWEKAKARSRKGKKGKAPSKNGVNAMSNGNGGNGGNGGNAQSHLNGTPMAPLMNRGQSQETQSQDAHSDFVDDENKGHGNRDVDLGLRPINGTPKVKSSATDQDHGGGDVGPYGVRPGGD